MSENKINGFVLIEDQAVGGWLENSLTSEEGRGVSMRLFGYFYEWLQEEGGPALRGLVPMDLVKKQKELNRGYTLDEILLPERKIILYEILRFLGSRPDWRTGYKRKIYSTIRSFFTYYLGSEGFPKPANGEEGKLKGRPRAKKDLTVEILRDLIYKSNPMYMAVWSCMLSAGMGIGEAVKWSDAGIQELRKALANPVRVGGVEMVELYLGARKLNLEMEFYTYVSGSALEYLKAWVKYRDKMEARPNAPRPFPDAIFVGNTYNPLTRKAAQFYWISKLKQLGLWESTGRRSSRTNMNIHQIRDTFKTRCHKASAFNGADLPLADYFMGHKSEKYDYDHVHNDRGFRIDQYILFQPWLDVKRIEIEGQSEELEAQKARIDELEDKLDRQTLITGIREGERDWRQNILVASVEGRTGDALALAEAAQAWSEGRLEDVTRIFESRASEARVEEALKAKEAKAVELGGESDALSGRAAEAETMEEQLSLRMEANSKMFEATALLREILKAKETKIEELKRDA